MVKLKDIAKELGLSVSTISRVVNGKDRVDPETRARVLQVLKRYNYTPNDVARSLRLGDAKTIGVIVPDITNDFYALVIKGIQSISRGFGYSVIVCNSDEDPVLEDDALRLLLKKQVSGLILASVEKTQELIQQYIQHSIPVVYIDNTPPSTVICDSVTINNIAAAYALTKELIKRGYTKIGVITGPLNQSTGNERCLGVQNALSEANLPIHKEWILEGDFKFASGQERMKQILSLKDRPHAMVIANNYMAYGAISTLKTAGLSIPKDMAIAAFDVLDRSGLISPRISTICQPAEMIGEKAMHIIIERMTGDSKEVFQNVLLTPDITDGESW